jgi:predicted outer membrane protein
MRKHYWTWFVFGVMCLSPLSVGCGDDDDDNGNGTAGRPAAGAGTSGTGADASGGAGGSGVEVDAAVSRLDDAQILGVLDTLNLGEVTEAETARPRLTTDFAQDFAEDMIEDHGEGRQQVSALAATLTLELAESPVQAELQEKSDARVTAIMDAEDAMVDDVYVSGQVEAHTAAVALLEQLAAVADDESLRQLIAMQKRHVEEHLEDALTLDD